MIALSEGDSIAVALIVPLVLRPGRRHVVATGSRVEFGERWMEVL
jgi:hypothetical protein